MLVPQKGHDIEIIDFSGLRGKNFMVWLTLPLRLLLAFWQSAKVLFQIRPDVVLGMGGYPSFPGGMMASLLNKPLLIHEQNSIPGLANKVLAKFADKVLLGFPDAIRNKKKVIISGNPVRKEICQLDIPDKRYIGTEWKTETIDNWWEPRCAGIKYRRTTDIETDPGSYASAGNSSARKKASRNSKKILCRSWSGG